MPIAIDQQDSTASVTASAPDSHPGDRASFPDLELFRVQNIPPAAYYVPDFITPDEEEFLLRKIQESPQPKWKTVGTGRRLQYWGGNLSKNGVLLPEPFPDWLTSFPHIVERIERFLAVSSKGTMVQSFNQVLINEYQPEQGISPHEDGPAFKPLVATISLGSHTVLDIHHYASTVSPSPPMTATVSSDPTPRTIAATPLAHLLVMPRSLLMLSSSLYTSHLHGIRAQAEDRVRIADDPGQEAGGADRIVNGELLGDAELIDSIGAGSWRGERGVRTSLTFRTAEKVLKGGGMFNLHKGLQKR